MNKKILSFVTKDGKLLALFSNPDPKHRSGWFVVTGELCEGEGEEDGVKREVKEETSLDVVETISLNWGSVYDWNGETCEEMNYMSLVKPGGVRLNEENIKYEWLDLDEFIERIRWEDDKEVLRKVLEKALKKEFYFKEKEVIDYRK